MYIGKRIILSPFIGRGWRKTISAFVFCGCLWALLVVRDIVGPSSLSLVSPVEERDLEHLRRSRHLADYLDVRSEPLITPQTHACLGADSIPLVVLVTSAPSHQEERAAIRSSWGAMQPTFFFMGHSQHADLGQDEQMIENYMEAKEYSDLVVGDYTDSYENLTVKVMHMFAWSLRSCPQARFVLKTDDDVLLNPWRLRTLLAEHKHDYLIGYMKNESIPHRDKESKWFLPYWLYPDNIIPDYLSGTGYIINGEYLEKVFNASFSVSLINLEDVFVTHLVAKQNLSLPLTHDNRLSPYKPLVPSACAYWDFALVHSMDPAQISRVWPSIKHLAENGGSGEWCRFYKKFLWFLDVMV